MVNQVRNKMSEDLMIQIVLIIDECKDNAEHEQLTYCIRSCKGAVATQRFLRLIRLETDFRAEKITELLLPLLYVPSTYGVVLGLTTESIAW